MFDEKVFNFDVSLCRVTCPLVQLCHSLSLFQMKNVWKNETGIESWIIDKVGLFLVSFLFNEYERE